MCSALRADGLVAESSDVQRPNWHLRWSGLFFLPGRWAYRPRVWGRWVSARWSREIASSDAFGAVVDGGDGCLADEAGEGSDAAGGALVEVGGRAGESAGSMLVGVEVVFGTGDGVAE